jgi:hypothetical protein
MPMRPEPSGAPEQAALLTGVAVCGFCGQPVRTDLRPTGRLAYRCQNDGQRPHLVRTAPPVDAWIRLLVLEHLERDDTPAGLADLDLPDLPALRARSAGLRTRLSQLTEATATGTVDRSAAAAGSERVAGELTAVEIDLTQHATQDLPTSLTGADPVELAWDRLGADRQRAALQRLTERITLHPVPPGRRAGEPDVLRSTVVVTWTDP